MQLLFKRCFWGRWLGLGAAESGPGPIRGMMERVHSHPGSPCGSEPGMPAPTKYEEITSYRHMQRALESRVVSCSAQSPAADERARLGSLL